MVYGKSSHARRVWKVGPVLASTLVLHYPPNRFYQPQTPCYGLLNNEIQGTVRDMQLQGLSRVYPLLKFLHGTEGLIPSCCEIFHAPQVSIVEFPFLFQSQHRQTDVLLKCRPASLQSS